MKRLKMEERLFLKVINGDVIAVNIAGNPRRTYYNKGDALRAYFRDDMGDGFVEVYLENGKILILNKGGNIRRII